MICRWKPEAAQRYVEGSLGTQETKFADHLAGCPICRERVAQAQHMEGLLRGAITPIAAPATLTSRVANAVAAERERSRRGKRILGGWRLSPALVGLAVVLLLSVTSYALAPEAVTALARKVLFFVPGLGIEPATEATLVAPGPVTARVGDAVFTLEALLSDGKVTMIKYTVSGLPGGKAGWDNPGRPRQPRLRDASGNEYTLLGASQGTGGTAEESIVRGDMRFTPLPQGLGSVYLTVPMDYVVPPTALPGSDSREWSLEIPLVTPEESDLPAATPQSAEMTRQGVTMRVAASTVEAEHTVVLVEGEAEGGARVSALGRMGGATSEMAMLEDERGRRYPLLPQGSSATLVEEALRKNLRFEPLAPGAEQLTLRVPAVQLWLDGSASITISLAGREVGETFELNQTVDLAGWPVVLKTARLGHDDAARQTDDSLWLYIDVDLGPTTDGRTLAYFQVARRGGSASMQSMGRRGGEQLDYFGVPVEPDAQEVTIQLSAPIVTVEGPWELSFPVGGE